MCLFETIKCENRQLQNLSYHNQRLNDSRKEMFGITEVIDLQQVIKIPDRVGGALFRCRVSYAESIQKVDFFEYEYKHPQHLKIIEDASIDYHLKFENRKIFQEYLSLNPNFDEIIFLQNNYITDTTYSNIALWNGENWVTPKNYLLKGTKRQYLIDNQLLIEDSILFEDLKKYKKIAFINAMRGLDLAYNFEIKANEMNIVIQN
jgi:4-amino-4-deoxychorismate lyase